MKFQDTPNFVPLSIFRYNITLLSEPDFGELLSRVEECKICSACVGPPLPLNKYLKELAPAPGFKMLLLEHKTSLVLVSRESEDR